MVKELNPKEIDSTTLYPLVEPVTVAAQRNASGAYDSGNHDFEEILIQKVFENPIGTFAFNIDDGHRPKLVSVKKKCDTGFAS